MLPDKTLRMANQIAAFMASKPRDEALVGFAEHLNTYWEPRMRIRFFGLVDAGGDGLHPIALDAAAQVRRPLSA
jgi:formate dehydrogenase subunit delta